MSKCVMDHNGRTLVAMTLVTVVVLIYPQLLFNAQPCNDNLSLFLLFYFTTYVFLHTLAILFFPIQLTLIHTPLSPSVTFGML